MRLWNTATRGLWSFGEADDADLQGGPEHRAAASQPSRPRGRRVYWLTYGGGNIREYDLWTATPTRTSPRRLAEASSDVDSGASPLVLGAGHARRRPVCRRRARSRTSPTTAAGSFASRSAAPYGCSRPGSGPGRSVSSPRSRTAASWCSRARGAWSGRSTSEPGGDGRVARASGRRSCRRVWTFRSVRQPCRYRPARGSSTTDRVGSCTRRGRRSVRVTSRRPPTRSLQTIPVPSFRQPLFSTDAWGSAWAKGPAVSWRGGPLPEPRPLARAVRRRPPTLRRRAGGGDDERRVPGGAETLELGEPCESRGAVDADAALGAVPRELERLAAWIVVQLDVSIRLAATAQTPPARLTPCAR